MTHFGPIAVALVVAFIVSLIISSIMTRLMISWAPTLGLIDRPGARKVHRHPTPMGGGVAIFVANLTTLLAVAAVSLVGRLIPAVADSIPESLRIHLDGVASRLPLLSLLQGLGLIQLLIGLVDDRTKGGLSYQLRLFLEVAIVAALFWSGVRVTLFNDWSIVSFVITLLWIVGLINAFNFLDNMDGLSAGAGFWASIFFAIIAWQIGSLFICGTFVILAGATAGFLYFNWSPAKIFMGDAGSNFIGFWIAVLTVSATFSTPELPHVTLAAPLCVLAVPIYDSATVILLRLAQGRSPFHADKQHLSHRLTELGFSTKHAVLLIHFLAITTGLAGVLLYYVKPEAAPLLLAQVGCSLALLAILEFAGFHRAKLDPSTDRSSHAASNRPSDRSD